jgi:hypothetical protein
VYHSKFRAIVSDLRALGERFIDDGLLNAFIQGLREEIRDKLNVEAVRDYEALDLEKVYSLASMHERVLNLRTAPQSANADRVAPNLRSADFANTACGFCRKPGHSFDDYPKVQKKKADGSWVYKTGQ